MTLSSIKEYESKKSKISEEIKNLKSVAISKKTSNLFRYREQSKTNKINVKDFNKVISIDTKKLICEVEGMTTYEDLVNETLKFNLMPCVVPELKTITIGGAATGIGIESSSFKYGFVHETIEEIEVLLPDGKTVVCNKSENKDLFFAFPNSYGTLGYALKLRLKLIPVKKYIKIEHKKYINAKDYFKDLKEICLSYRKNNNIQFIDGTVFNENEMYITLGSFVDEAPFTSNYKFMNIYYKSIRKNKIDYLTTLDYIWRWDTDWFWCSKHFYVQNPVIRLIFGKFLLRSSTYWKIKSLANKYGLTKLFENKKITTESIVQDVGIPIENCEKFLDFFHTEIGIKPVWVCPMMNYKDIKYTIYTTDSNKLYVNFGFWDIVKTNKKVEEGYFNKKIEKVVSKLNGKKSLYSTSFYSEKEFWKLYNGINYFKLKNKYDKGKKFKNLYEKTVKRN